METTGGTAVPIIKKKHYSIEDYKKKIDPQTLKKLEDELKNLKENKS